MAKLLSIIYLYKPRRILYLETKLKLSGVGCVKDHNLIQRSYLFLFIESKHIQYVINTYVFA